MLSADTVNRILSQVPRLTIGVIGDLFLDRYLDIDLALTEKSIETGLDAYQVVGVKSSPGAAGTVINNLAALGVGRVVSISIIGDDGEGYELMQALRRMACVDTAYIIQDQRRRTPTYTKPMLLEGGGAKELNRLDIKNRNVLPSELEQSLINAIETVFSEIDALLVMDQVSEPDCGVITKAVRNKITGLGEKTPDKFILADSRQRIGLFRFVCIKPNVRECLECVAQDLVQPPDIETAVCLLSKQTRRTVFCTLGERGMLVAAPGKRPHEVIHVPAYPVTGPIDIVGAGDSSSAAITCALAAGVSSSDAAAFGNLAASITIRQIGTTGTATPAQLLEAISSE